VKEITTRAPRNRWAGIGGKLFLSYLLVTAVGVVTLFLGVSYLAPVFFDRSMMGMMGGSVFGMDQAMNDEINQSFRQAMTSSLLMATSVAVIAAVVASYLFSQRIVSPVLGMLRASRRIASGHYAERVTVRATDELGELRDSFNQMAASLEETERRRLALIGDVAHELRTPLSTIEGYAEGLLDGVVDGSPETFALIHKEARRLRRLVDDLQELSRAEARQLSLHPRPIVPQHLIDAALVRLQPQFDEKGLTLTIEVPDRLPEILADEDRTVQVLTNLMGNALSYTPAGGHVAVRVRTLGDQVKFIVSDSGIGIAAEHLPHLFERFYRVDRSRSRAIGGSGVGLTIARHLVEAQGGTIEAKSPGLGKGATFSFTLPTVR